MEGTISRQKHLDWIDAAKGICMISIIIGHMGQQEEFFWIYSYHVPVFFILSGYTLKEKPLSADYLKNSFRRLMVPYFITCFFVIISDPVKEFILNGTTSVYDLTKTVFTDIADTVLASGTSGYIAGISTDHYIGAIWFLPALFFARIFTQITVKHIKSWNVRLLAGGGLLISAVFMRGLRFFLPFSLLPGACGTFFVLAGMFIRERRIFEKLKIKYCLAALITILLICVYGIFTGNSEIISISIAGSRFADPVICAISSLCACVIVIKISMLVQKNRFLLWFGRNSLTVLCVHLFTLKILQSFILRCIFPLFPFELERGTYIYTIILAAFHVLICSVFVIASDYLGSRRKERVKISHQNPGIKTVFRKTAGKFLSSECCSDADKIFPVSEAVLAVSVISLPLDLYGTFRTMLNTFVFAALALIQGYRINRDLSEQKKQYPQSGNTGSFSVRFFVLQLREGVTELIIPYVIFSVFYIATRGYGIAGELEILAESMAVSGKFLAYYSSVGVAWIIPAMFFSRVIYTFVLCISRKKYAVPAIILILSALGTALGTQDIFLPCSLDISLFMTVFFYAGHVFYEYGFIEWYTARPWLYFFAAAAQAYILYSYTINYADREYEIWAFSVLGGIAGTLILFNIAHFICSRIPLFTEAFYFAVSRSIFFVILACALLQPILQEALSDFANLAEKGMANGLICCAAELLAGTAAGGIYFAAGRRIKGLSLTR